MEGLTILGGHGFVGGEYVKQYYDAAIRNIANINARDDVKVYSNDVLYFVSTVHNGNVYTDPLLDINTNLVHLVKTLESWRLRDDPGVFNFVSSWFVLSDIKGFYTSTKRCAEELLESYCKAYGLNYRILRLSNVLGVEDKKVSNRKNALQYVIKQLAEGSPVVLRPVLREYIHVKDCVRAIELVMCKGEVNKTYNIGSGTLENFKEAAMYAALELGSTSEIVTYTYITESAVLLDTSALRELGFTPEYKFTSILDELIAGARDEKLNRHNQR